MCISVIGVILNLIFSVSLPSLIFVTGFSVCTLGCGYNCIFAVDMKY